MAETGVRIFGDKALAKKMAKFEKSLSAKLHPRMARSALFVAREAQKLIRGKRATNPPDLLGIITGRLRGSIIPDVARDGLSATVGTNVEYARKHELGIDVRARPFLGPALKKSEPFILKELGKGIDAALKEI